MAVPPLRALHEAGFEIPLVVSRADTRRGRGGTAAPSPVKAAALELGIPVTDQVDDLLPLAASGEADSLQQEGESLYRACTPGTHHHHLICRNCGLTVEIEADAVEQWARQVASEHGFTQPNHVVDVFGLCAECSALAG